MDELLADVLEIVGEIHHAEDLPTFRRALLDVLPRVIPCDYVGYNEVGWDGTVGLTLVVPEQTAALHAAWARWGHQNPLLRRYQETRDGRAYRFSDVIGRAALEALELYAEVYAPMGQEHQLAVTIPAPPRMIVGIALGAKVDFTDAQRRVLDLARPHIIQALRNAEARERLQRVFDTVAHGLDDSGEALVVADARGRLEFSTAAGRAALALLGGSGEEGVPLPAALAPVLAEGPRASLDVPGGPPLIVRRVPAVNGASTALVFERGPRGASLELLEALGLSRRQAEVLRGLMRGQATGAIAAAMDISPRTVHKHVERIFAKLGVRDRVGAVSAAWAAVDAPHLPDSRPAPDELAERSGAGREKR